ncbi:hypothetical protein B566_EDAN013551 [Ephemera danica]|nr:hypothetical protein B566_EDAN013551 [Ephemera danica]
MFSPSATAAAVDTAAVPSDLKVMVLQMVVGFVTALQLVAPGMALGFSAVALPQLRNENLTSFEPLTEAQGSWFASISSISTPIGCLLSGWMMERWGRRLSLLLLNLPGLAGWALITVANGLIPLYAGRLLTGLSLGMASASSNVYLGEVTTSQLRGALMCWNSLSIALGILIVYILGWFLPWNWAAGCAIIPTVLSLMTAFFIPESASWLLAHSQPEAAEKALICLRGGGGPDVRAELEKLIIDQEKRALAAQESSKETGIRKFTSSLRRPEFWKPLLIMNLFFAFQQFSGIYVVIFYAVDMASYFEGEAEGRSPLIDKYLAAVLIGVARLSVTAVVSMIMRHVGRRPLALLSGIGMTLCMLVLSVYVILFYDIPSIVPMIFLIGFILTSTIGFMTLPWAMLGEVFPAELRGVGGGVTTCMAYLLSFAAIKAYPAMNDMESIFNPFVIYFLFSLAGTVFVGVWLPETGGRTLQEIETSFAGKKPQQAPPRDMGQPLNAQP